MTGADAPTPLPDRVDVAILGAGPTGLTLTCALAFQAVAIAVLDQAAEGGTTSRAAVIHARTLEVLEAINLSKDLVSRGIVVPRFAIRDRGRTCSPFASTACCRRTIPTR